MNPAAATLVTLLGLLACQPGVAAEIVVLGRLVSNEPMSYVSIECPADAICMRSWWKSVIRVDKVLQGPPVSGRITTAVLQHTDLTQRYKKALRLFVLTPIEDPERRAKLRADYYLEEQAESARMFCLSRDPEQLGLQALNTRVFGAGDDTTYCFQLPDD